MPEKLEILHGSLAFMILKTLDAIGPLHGYGLARRIEQISGGQLTLNYGTVYPALIRLEQTGWIRSEWGASENNRRAKYYALTRKGRSALAAEADQWARTSEIVSRFLKPSKVLL